jgi:hypothetical protein
MVMKLASWLGVIVGFITLSLAIYGQIANVAYEAAIGVFFVMLGFNGFTSLRIAKLEEEIKKLKKGSNS